MERRFEVLLQQAAEGAVLDPRIPQGMLARLEKFVRPFTAGMTAEAQPKHVWEYVAGLLSTVPRKNAEAIAYFHDRERQGLQKFLGQIPWDERPAVTELARQVGAELGEADGVLVFDPSAFPKKGKHSVGVAPQWCGRLGQVTNCQVGVYLGYVSRREQTLVDVRLYLPQEWASDRKRRKECGVPKAVRFQTRHQLALAMLREHRGRLPHAWVAGDDEMGHSTAFRGELRAMQEQYLLAVAANTLVRDLSVPPPPYGGRGRPPRTPFQQVRRWCAALPKGNWTQIEVRPGTKGPLIVEGVMTRAQAKTEGRRVGPEETLVVLRTEQEDGTLQYDYYLSDAPATTPLAEFARVAKAEHRIEECLKRAKSEAGLGDYQVRTWIGWHHHQALALLATWFLTQEKRRGEKIHAMCDTSSSARPARLATPAGAGLRRAGACPP